MHKCQLMNDESQNADEENLLVPVLVIICILHAIRIC